MKKANKILLIVIAVLFIGIATYVGLKSWSGFVVPNLEKISQFPLPILFGFALLAGAISFFAPCSIGLFPGEIVFYFSFKKGKRETPVIWTSPTRLMEDVLLKGLINKPKTL